MKGEKLLTLIHPVILNDIHSGFKRCNPTHRFVEYLPNGLPATLLSACKCYVFCFGTEVATVLVSMAEKQSSKNAVKQLLDGRLDPNTRLAEDLAQAVEERVLKNTAKPAESSH